MSEGGLRKKKYPINTIAPFITFSVQVVEYESREPLSGLNYELELPDGTTRTGTTDENGYIEESKVPSDSYTLKILNPDYHYIFGGTEEEETTSTEDSWSPPDLGPSTRL